LGAMLAVGAGGGAARAGSGLLFPACQGLRGRGNPNSSGQVEMASLTTSFLGKVWP